MGATGETASARRNAMGVFGRISRIIKSNINALLDAAEDPEKSLSQIIIDMEKNYREAKEQVAQSMVDERKLSRKLDKAKSEAVGWKQKAQTAVRAGKDDLAKQALLRAKETANLAIELEKQLEQQRRAVENLRFALGTLEKKIDEAKRKKHVLLARKRTVEATQKISARVDKIKVDKSAFDEFDRVAEKIEDMEIKAGIMIEMSSDRLEDQIAREEIRDELDDELDALKSEMGLLPGGAAGLLEEHAEEDEDDDDDEPRRPRKKTKKKVRRSAAEDMAAELDLEGIREAADELEDDE